jgi:hypothetical protein
LDDQGTAIDDEGLALANVDRVQKEAACSLSDAASDVIATTDCQAGCMIAIGVRDEYGPVLRLKWTLEVKRLRTN